MYRVRQFTRAASAWVKPQETGVELVGQYLGPEALHLFLSMPRYDQRHALNVMLTLQREGHTDPDLLAAALLHDVGKTVYWDGVSSKGRRRTGESGALFLWHRVAVVLMRAFRPGLLERVAAGGSVWGRSKRWQRPVVVQQNHAAMGAELACRAGCSPMTVALIGQHEESADLAVDPLLVALQAADSVN